ncbi:pyridoxal-dependent decarboxylase [Mumia zhuanghuii]|uniref:Pyridoxal phosphate-dependent decarboxylase family protein n=2 Tax=Mumia TaxID=1546255 RepID=A0ABW1QLH5_9ACTN|nr:MULTISPECIES: pyridoxal-dependent decarboxylase [Mumia]KAA1419775.1 pyridoxal-dependent decarboxylase [Mumia zhuanghuii]
MNLSPLLTNSTADEYARTVHAVVERIAGQVRDCDAPFSGTAREVLERKVTSVDLDGSPIGTDRALDEVDALFVQDAVWFHHPAYAAHLNCPVAIPAVAAEAVLAAVNTSVDTYDQSTVGTYMERHLIGWTARRIGFDGGAGVFTSGGTQSNLHALFLAREHALSVHGSGVLAAAERSTLQQRMLVLATEHSHFSVQKSALLLGLGEGAVICVPTDRDGRMDADALRLTLDVIERTGRIAMAVVATAGTTDRGCIDPLRGVADACDSARTWMHVDAAYGGGLLVSPTRRHLLDGIERAHSVTVDFHKSFFQPVSSSAILVREAADLARSGWHADYLNPDDADEPNQVDTSLQTTRRFDALKLWTTLRALGADRIGAMFDRVLDLTVQVHRIVEDAPDLHLLARTDLSTVLFRYQHGGMSDLEADRLVPVIRAAMLASGRALVAKTVVDGRPCLKLTLLNPDTTAEDVRGVLAIVRATGERGLDSLRSLDLAEDRALLASGAVAR